MRKQKQVIEEPISIPSPQVTAAQLQRLVTLLDNSDVSEVEVKQAELGMRLVLRKATSTEAISGEVVATVVANKEAETTTAATPTDRHQIITATLVGIFRTWAKPKGGPVIHVGDHIKIGQVVGSIQSLNVINEVESPVEGRLVEILVQDGQPVEYGQALLVIEGGEE